VFRELKGQSSLEYLTNYGWMLVTVAIVGGTMYSQIGGTNTCNIQTSGFSAPFPTVEDQYQYENETLILQIRNPDQEDITLEEMVIRENNEIVGVVDANQPINGESSENIPTNRFSTSENCVTRDLEIKYASATLDNLTVEGTLTGKLALVPLVALFDINPAFAESGEEITFNASRTESENAIQYYNWSFGDGETAQGEVVTHSYSQDGIYSVELTVEDVNGTTTRRIKQVYIGGILSKRGGEFPALQVGETVATSCIGDECSRIEEGDEKGVSSEGVELEGTLITQEILKLEDSLCLTSQLALDTDSGCPSTEEYPRRTVSIDQNEIFGWLGAPTIQPQDEGLCIGDCQTN
jgi:hypothetical protein